MNAKRLNIFDPIIWQAKRVMKSYSKGLPFDIERPSAISSSNGCYFRKTRKDDEESLRV